MKKVGKIIQLDYDYISGLDTERKCYSLSTRTVSILLSQLEYLHWDTRWYSPTNAAIIQDTIDEFADTCADELMSEDECMSGGCCPEQLDAINRLYSLMLQQADTGTAQSFAPDAPTSYSGNAGQTPAQAAQRQAALCAAVTGYAMGVLQAALTAIGGAAVATAIALLLSFFTGQYWVIPAIVASVSGVVAGDLLLAVADTSAIKRVICAMQASLNGRQTTQANFANSLRETSFEPGSHEATLARVLSVANQLPENYRNFVMQLGTNYNIAGDSDDPCFDCCEPIPELRIDATWPSAPPAFTTSGATIERIGERRWRFTPGIQSNNDFYQLWVQATADCNFCVKDFYLSETTGYSQAQKWSYGNPIIGTSPGIGDCLNGFNLSRPAGTFICEIEICDNTCDASSDCIGCD